LFRFNLWYFVRFACFSSFCYLRLVYFVVILCVFGVFSPVCFELSVPGQVPGNTPLRNDLLCVERDVKLYSLIQALA